MQPRTSARCKLTPGTIISGPLAPNAPTYFTQPDPTEPHSRTQVSIIRYTINAGRQHTGCLLITTKINDTPEGGRTTGPDRHGTAESNRIVSQRQGTRRETSAGTVCGVNWSITVRNETAQLQKRAGSTLICPLDSCQPASQPAS